MRILVASSELVPFAKTGGLGDVVGSLPKAMAIRGHDVKVIIPRYSSIDFGRYQVGSLARTGSVSIKGKRKVFSVSFIKDKKMSAEYYFIGNDRYFDRSGMYRDPKSGSDYLDNDERFSFFSRSVLQIAKMLDWAPDIVHVHDWQSGLIPVYLKTEYAGDPFFVDVKSVLTIHNLAYQGTFESERFSTLGLPEDLFYPASPFEFYGKVNFLKAAIVYADKITTVSKRYAREIQTDEYGCGLQGVLKERAADLAGIQNGVDYVTWSPSRDKRIPHTYYLANLSGKKTNKVELLGQVGLPIRERTPLIGIISRLVDQKGFDLIAKAADEIFELNIQMIVLGTGEKKYHELFADLQSRYPDKLRAFFTFDEDLAHRIEAGADMFLMPSRFEPSGLNQLFSLRYGTVPIVREVGGLADTVVDYDPDSSEGTGFVFKEYSAEALLSAIKRAAALFSKRRLWVKIMKAGMLQDFSWDRSAQEYCELFQDIVHK